MNVLRASIKHLNITKKSNSSLNCISSRYAHTGALEILQAKIEEQAAPKLAQVKSLKQNSKNTPISQNTVGTILGGMRGSIALLSETSEVDAYNGLKYQGHTIEDCQNILPSFKGGNNPYSESLIWLLLTGQIPTEEEVSMLSKELAKRAYIPEHVFDVVNKLPAHTHPMTQLVIGVAALQTESSFANKYREGLHKTQYWKAILDDGLSMVAKVPGVAAYVYNKTFKQDQSVPYYNPNKDWAANYSQMLGYTSTEHEEFMRLYMFLHADHEGGNVSAHTATLIGSALSDPYLCFSGSMAGLAGPLHGLANQESLKWLMATHKQLNGEQPTVENIKAIAEATLKSGRVIPGYGHAVLRVTDPRFTAQKKFATENLPDFDLFKLLNVCTSVVPDILLASGKVQNPYPNVDCHSGVLLQHFGLVEEDYYTVLFGVSRSIGVVSQLVWSRLLSLPIERPKSISINKLGMLAEKSSS